MSSEEDDRRLTRIRAAIAGRLADHPGKPLQSIGEGRNIVMVRLKPNALSVAEELNREFGRAIEITVGFKGFPEWSSRVPSPHVLEGRGSLPAIHATCEVDAARLHSGDAVTGKLVMQNSGHTDIEGSVSAGAGWLCRPGTLKIVGGYSGLITNVDRVFHISPSGSEALNFVVGTASCEPGSEYVVQPGRYEVVVPVDLEMKSAQGTVRILARDCFIEVM